MRLAARILTSLTMFYAASALAYGPDGHHTIGAIADRLIAGTNAEQQVSALLSPLSVEQAAVWADCAKGVDAKTLKYAAPASTPSVPSSRRT